MFVGRKQEIKIIKEAIQTPGNNVIVYGNRRIGKTTLINEAMKDSPYIYVTFECLKSSLKNNIDALCKLLFKIGLVPSYIRFDSMLDLFSYINDLGKRVVFLIDEYPYLYYKNDSNTVDSYFQAILDQHSNNLNLIFSGSHIGMMKGLLNYSNPLFGRFNKIIHLKELNYLEASEFYPNLSNYDKVAFYSVFGGSPFILNQLKPELGLEENIYNTFLTNDSPVFLFLSEGFTSDILAKDSSNQIFEAIGNSRLRYKRIEEKVGYEHNGLLSKQLSLLTEMEFIDKNVPINKLNDNKKTTYYIRNNALRFYFAYVYGYVNFITVIGYKTYYERYIKDSIKTFISYGFETIVKDYLSLAVRNGLYDGIYNIGTYYYDDQINKENGEFDVAIALKEGYDIIEVKYYSEPISQTLINKESKQIQAIQEIDIKGYGFASINGFKNISKDYKYLIDGDVIYFKNKRA